MFSFRTKETENKLKSSLRDHKKEYLHYLCTAKSIKDFKYWRIINNNYPYDKIAQTHHILTPKRHVPKEVNLTKEEYKEFLEIKKFLETEYHIILENLPLMRSIPGHYHLHLIKIIK